jgi:hypothetical protein
VPFFLVAQEFWEKLAAPSQVRVNRTAALPLKLHDAMFDVGFERCRVVVGVGNHAAEAGMHFVRACKTRHLCDIGWMQAAVRKNGEAIPGQLDERLKNRRTSQRVGSAAGSQDALRARNDDVL